MDALVSFATFASASLAVFIVSSVAPGCAVRSASAWSSALEIWPHTPCRFCGSAASRFSNRSAREERVIARRGGLNTWHHRLHCLLRGFAPPQKFQQSCVHFV